MSPEHFLFANDAFYLAFRERDLDAMERIWARNVSVICIHPGWNPLTTRAEVMASWQAILTNPDAPRIQIYGGQVFQHGDVASVVCYEQLDAGILVATNNFIIENGEPRLVHHQASDCADPPAPPQEKQVMQ
ncbi:MAG: nuclear transport factor 2 family protein [Pseudomonadales bacterium]